MAPEPLLIALLVDGREATLRALIRVVLVRRVAQQAPAIDGRLGRFQVVVARVTTTQRAAALVMLPNAPLNRRPHRAPGVVWRAEPPSAWMIQEHHSAALDRQNVVIDRLRIESTGWS